MNEVPLKKYDIVITVDHFLLDGWLSVVVSSSEHFKLIDPFILMEPHMLESRGPNKKVTVQISPLYSLQEVIDYLVDHPHIRVLESGGESCLR